MQQIDQLTIKDIDELLLQLNQQQHNHVAIGHIHLAQLNNTQQQVLLSHLQAKKKQQVLVLSTAQERIWQLDQIMPNNPVYNFQSAINLQGLLNYQALSKAVTAIVMKHETLRTCYGSLQGKAHLTLLPSLSVQIEPFDWSHLPQQQQHIDLQAAIRQTAQTGFTLSQPPLFKLQCYKMRQDEHVLVLTMHHIVSDLLSMELFFEELSFFYNHYVSGQNPLITAPELSYQAYASTQRTQLNTLLQGPSADFWRNYLANAPKIEWYSDFPRTKTATGKAATAHFSLTPAIVKSVEQLARNEQVTPFVVLLSLYYLFQFAISGSEQQLTAVPNAGRNSAEVENLIGMFSSPIPILVDFSDIQNFRQLLQKVKTSVFAITEHADVPFGNIVELAQDTSDRQPPWVRSMFSFINRMKTFSFSQLQLTRTPTERGISDFDLFMTIYRDNDNWHGVFEYNTDLFSKARGDDWAQTYTRLVEMSVNNDIEQPITQLTAEVTRPKYLRVAVAATFTADPLEEVVSFWQQELNLPTHLNLAPYNQVFQTLMSQDSVLYQQDNTLNVLLINPEDWVRYQTNDHQYRSTLIKVANEFIEAVVQAKLVAPTLIYFCPSSPDSKNVDDIEYAIKLIETSLCGIKGITLMHSHAISARYQLSHYFDQQANDIGHIPYTRDWFAALGTEVVRKAHSLSRKTYKVLALDCDNTLWQGVCGEEGALGVKINQPFKLLQKFVQQQIEAGMLVCLVSKNEEIDVLQVFDSHPDMILKREHIVGQRINWLAKSENLRSLAAELSLGLDSFIFIDDNPVECAEVQAFAPEVLTLCLPKDMSSIATYLDNVWAFDKHQTSQEDRQRTVSYQQNKQREALRQEYDSFSEFLEKLELNVDFITHADDQQLTRIAQLSRRTNQFNNNHLQYDEIDLQQLIADGYQIVGIDVQDRFGRYGLVGALLYQQQGHTINIDKFMLSCRVLGKGVEHKIIAWLGQQALNHGASEIVIHVKKLARNQPFYRFIDGLSGQWDNNMAQYCLSSESASQATFIPQSQEQTAINDKHAVATSHVSDVSIRQQNALIDIALNLRHADEILHKLDKYHSRPKTNKSVINPPQGKIEQAIAEIWQSALRTDAIDRDDNFFEISGNSLLLVQINAKLNEHFNRDIAITTLFQYPTISTLANHLRSDKTPYELNADIQQRAGNARTQLQQRMSRLQRTRIDRNQSA